MRSFVHICRLNSSLSLRGRCFTSLADATSYHCCKIFLFLQHSNKFLLWFSVLQNIFNFVLRRCEWNCCLPSLFSFFYSLQNHGKKWKFKICLSSKYDAMFSAYSTFVVHSKNFNIFTSVRAKGKIFSNSKKC